MRAARCASTAQARSALLLFHSQRERMLRRHFHYVREVTQRRRKIVAPRKQQIAEDRGAQRVTARGNAFSPERAALCYRRRNHAAIFHCF